MARRSGRCCRNQHKNLIFHGWTVGGAFFGAISLVSLWLPGGFGFSATSEEETQIEAYWGWKRIKGDNKSGGNAGAVVSGRNEDRAISYRTPSARKQFIPLHCSALTRPTFSFIFLILYLGDFWSYTFLARFPRCGVRNSKNARTILTIPSGNRVMWDNFFFLSLALSLSLSLRASGRAIRDVISDLEDTRPSGSYRWMRFTRMTDFVSTGFSLFFLCSIAEKT